MASPVVDAARCRDLATLIAKKLIGDHSELLKIYWFGQMRVSISSPARKARHRKPSHFGSNWHPISRGNSSTSRAFHGVRIQRHRKRGIPLLFDFLAARCKSQTALALINRLIADVNGRSDSQ